MKTKKHLIDSVAISNTAVLAYHLPTILESLLILQNARRPAGREKVLYGHELSCLFVIETSQVCRMPSLPIQ